MKQATLCFLLDFKENKILLGLKKTGFGEGKFNGFGGKIEENETIEQAAVRELFEEAGIMTDIGNLKKVAELIFRFPHAPEKNWDQVVHVFLTDSWDGEPQESSEMIPKWIELDKIPFDRMWDDDRHWLPLVLDNKNIKARFSFKEDNKTVHEYDLEEADFY